MSGANTFKFLMLPPQSETTRGWGKRLAEALPEVRVVIADTPCTSLGSDHVDCQSVRKAEHTACFRRSINLHQM